VTDKPKEVPKIPDDYMEEKWKRIEEKFNSMQKAIRDTKFKLNDKNKGDTDHGKET